MLTDKLKSLLKKHNLWAKKKFGQNFLIDEQILCSIIKAAELKKFDNIVEVGPGTGSLTEKLVKSVFRVLAIEKDTDMIRILQDNFSDIENLTLINEDVLKLPIQSVILNLFQDPDCKQIRDPSNKVGMKNIEYKVVANIPYYITSPLLKHFLQADNPPEMMILLVQKEVAEKICGLTGKSLITIETQLFGEPEIIDIVPAKCFYPTPKVDSAILKIKLYKSPLVPADQLKNFLRIVKFGFSQKRKKLKSSLAAGLHLKPSDIKDILIKLDIDPDCRAENLEIEDWKKLVNNLSFRGVNDSESSKNLTIS